MKFLFPESDDFSFEKIEFSDHQIQSIEKKSISTKIDKFDDCKVVFKIRGEEYYLEDLSTGYISLLTILINIVAWIEIINPIQSKYITEAVGIVLIDEIDLHLHPKWQINIRDGLLKLFPNLQFILTTHSPYIIQRCRKGEIIFLPEINEKSFDLEPSIEKFSGWNIDEISRSLLLVKNLEHSNYKNLKNRIANALAERNGELIKDLLLKLEEITSSENSLVAKIKARLNWILDEDNNDKD
ncbi:AAA family ATPase [Candidatus Lokiarchaeum ossiferum]|uniref:AAA family ATPase n=1 Tax=Candidatus Lokiarchaeum ossiferum TaxID=2951803 RepID=UPI00352E70B2